MLAAEQQELAGIPDKGANIHAPAPSVDRLHLEPQLPIDTGRRGDIAANLEEATAAFRATSTPPGEGTRRPDSHLEYLLPQPPPDPVPAQDTWTLGLADEGATVAKIDADKSAHGPGPHLDRQSGDVDRQLTAQHITAGS